MRSIRSIGTDSIVNLPAILLTGATEVIGNILLRREAFHVGVTSRTDAIIDSPPMRYRGGRDHDFGRVSQALPSMYAGFFNYAHKRE